ncbi:PepSY-associated TM helix domain-containing protein [Edaphobacter bradus]|uniref:PepSY-associated TM helix domain-containing protein n=1 Tax=Edaphobacter bradus TaxID=2259016 RepID=UPI0021DF8EE5|nr:PepSY-associated TM helix domain-containing protein [Edaphobacter bradus]
MKLRTILFWTHLLTGCVFGLFIAFMASTGMLLAYQRQAFTFAERNVSISEVKPGARRLPIEELVRRATILEGTPPPSALILRDVNEPVCFQTGRFTVLYLDPYTGASLGHGAIRVRRFFATVEGLHRWFGISGGLRSRGRSLKAAANLGLLVMLLTGFCLWWPTAFRVRYLRPIVCLRRGLKGRARNWNWHNTFGIWTLPLLLVIVLTGTILSYGWANDLLFRTTGNAIPAEDHVFRPAGALHVLSSSPRWEPLLGRAESQLATWQRINLIVPDDANAPVLFTIDSGNGGKPQSQGELVLNARTGEVLSWVPFRAKNLGQRLRELARWTHTGESVGIIGQTAAFLAAAGALVLVWTGLALALHRLRAWQARNARVTARNQAAPYFIPVCEARELKAARSVAGSLPPSPQSPDHRG